MRNVVLVIGDNLNVENVVTILNGVIIEGVLILHGGIGKARMKRMNEQKEKMLTKALENYGKLLIRILALDEPERSEKLSKVFKVFDTLNEKTNLEYVS